MPWESCLPRCFYSASELAHLSRIHRERGRLPKRSSWLLELWWLGICRLLKHLISLYHASKVSLVTSRLTIVLRWKTAWYKLMSSIHVKLLVLSIKGLTIVSFRGSILSILLKLLNKFWWKGVSVTQLKTRLLVRLDFTRNLRWLLLISVR